MIVTSTEYLAVLQANGTVVSSAGQTLLTQSVPFIQQMVEKFIGFPIERATYTEYYPSAITNQGGAAGDTLRGGWDMATTGQAVMQRGQNYRRNIGLNKLPARSITEIRENWTAWRGGPGGTPIPYFPSTSILPATSYQLDVDEDGIGWSGRVLRLVGVWARDLRTIKITYVAGLTQDEINVSYTDLKMAMLSCIQAFYIGSIMRSNAGTTGGWVASESMTDWSKSYGDPRSIGMFFENNFAMPPEAIRILSRYVNLRAYFTGN